MTRAELLEGAFRPIDVVRREAFAYAWKLPWIATALRRSEVRIPLLASASVVVAFVLTVCAPGVLFVLGPAFFGVPHLASDLRYLLVRPSVPRAWLLTASVACVLLVAVRVAELVDPSGIRLGRVEVVLGWGWAIAGAWMGASAARKTGARARAALATVPLAAAAVAAGLHPGMARALFAYGHNLVALLVWVVLFRRRKTVARWPLALVALGIVVLATGATSSWLADDAPWMARLLDEARFATGLASRPALLVALTYLFLQAVHYSIWLTWIPRETVRPDASLTFRMSARAALRDFRWWGLLAIAVAAAAVVVSSFVSVHRTRAVYLSVATFHGYLELACLAFLWVRGA